MFKYGDDSIMSGDSVSRDNGVGSRLVVVKTGWSVEAETTALGTG